MTWLYICLDWLLFTEIVNQLNALSSLDEDQDDCIKQAAMPSAKSASSSEGLKLSPSASDCLWHCDLLHSHFCLLSCQFCPCVLSWMFSLVICSAPSCNKMTLSLTSVLVNGLMWVILSHPSVSPMAPSLPFCCASHAPSRAFVSDLSTRVSYKSFQTENLI